MNLSLKNENKILYIYMVLQVFSDLITTYLVRNVGNVLSLSTFFRGGFLFFCVIIILRKGNKREKLFLFSLVMFISVHTLFQSYRFGYSLTYHLMTIIKTFTFPLFILYFSSLFRRNYEISNKQFIFKLFKSINIATLTYSLIVIFMGILKIGNPSYPGNIDMRIGSIGYFLAANEMGPFLISLSACSMVSLFIYNSLLSKFALFFGLISLSFVGTKSSLMGLIAVCTIFIIYSIFERIYNGKKNNFNFFMVILVTLVIPLSPSYLNLSIQKMQTEERTYYSTLKKGDSIREKDQLKHDQAPLIDLEGFIESTTLSLDDENMYLEGYLFPLYEDLGHPDFVDISLKITTRNGNKEYPLVNVFNPHVENPKEDIYSSKFSGFKGSINLSNIDFNEKFTMTLILVIDKNRVYEVNPEVFILAQPNMKYELLKSDNGNVSLVEKVGFDSEVNTAIIDQPTDLSIFVNRLLSGRAKRLTDYLSKLGDFSLVDAIVGTGQLRYGVVGFEMDPLEVFIIYGFVGISFFFGQMIVILLKTISNNFKKHKENFNKIFIGIILITLILLISMIGLLAGHTFIAPRNSIMLSLLLLIAYYLSIGDYHGAD